MLGREDQRRFREIERELAAEDPEFARRIRETSPPPSFVDRRWPLVVLMFVSAMACWLGALSVSLFWVVMGLIGVVFAVAAYWRQVKRRGRL